MYSILHKKIKTLMSLDPSNLMTTADKGSYIAVFGTGWNYCKSEFPTCKICSPDQFSHISQSDCRKRDATSDFCVWQP